MKTSEGSSFVQQESFTLRMLSKFGLANAQQFQSPLERENSDTSEFCVMSVSVLDKVLYREAVGSLMILASATLPDLSFPVSAVARSIEKPTDANQQKFERVFCCLRGTIKHGLLYRADSKQGIIEIYSDSGFANDLSRR